MHIKHLSIKTAKPTHHLCRHLPCAKVKKCLIFYKNAKIMNITERRKLKLLWESFKILYRNCPEYNLKDFATTIYVRRQFNQQNNGALLAPFVTMEAPENCCKVVCYRQVNALTLTRPNENVNAFTGAVKKDLFANYNWFLLQLSIFGFNRRRTSLHKYIIFIFGVLIWFCHIASGILWE